MNIFKKIKLWLTGKSVKQVAIDSVNVLNDIKNGLGYDAIKMKYPELSGGVDKFLDVVNREIVVLPDSKKSAIDVLQEFGALKHPLERKDFWENLAVLMANIFADGKINLADLLWVIPFVYKNWINKK